jgi:xanthine/uracil permease
MDKIKSNVVYGIDSKPKLKEAIPLGIQHVLTLFGATTLVPLILGSVIFGAGNHKAIAQFIGNIYFVMGVATLIQLYFGSKLPIVQGSSFAFITPIIAVSTVLQGNSPETIMQYIGGALIVGGIIEAVIGYSGLVGKLKKIITPVVMGPTIMLIGFSLVPVAINLNAANYWPISLLVVAFIFIFSLITKGKTRLFPVLLSLIIVYILCIILLVIGVFYGSEKVVDLKIN